MGAVPFQDAKWARLAKRLTSAMSLMRRATPDEPMPCRCCSQLPGRGDQFGQLLFRDFDLLVDQRELMMGRPPICATGR